MIASIHRATPAPPKLAAYNERIPYLIGAISNLLSSRSSRFYQRAFGIGLGEMRLIWVMSYVPSLTVQRAAQIMGIDKGATSRSVAALVRRKLVRASVDKTDNRRRTIVFTEAGKTFCDRIMIVSAERERWLSNIFTPDELVVLRELLNRLLVSAREVSEHDPPPKAR
jgi:DNA-binding MarR family transcriptional regulator